MSLALAGVLAVLGPWEIRAQPRRTVPQPGDSPLAGNTGPYQGPVVELLTDRPLADAPVILLWDRTDPPGHDGRLEVAARETVTDARGEFVLDAPDVERSPAEGALTPRLLVDKAGHVSLPRELEPGLGVPVAWLRERGGVIALKPAGDEEERIEAFNTGFFLASRRLEFRSTFKAPGSGTHWHRIMRAELQRFIDESTRNPGAFNAKP